MNTVPSAFSIHPLFYKYNRNEACTVQNQLRSRVAVLLLPAHEDFTLEYGAASRLHELGQERNHEREQTSGFGEGKTQNGILEHLVLQAGVARKTENKGTENNTDTSTSTWLVGLVDIPSERRTLSYLQDRWRPNPYRCYEKPRQALAQAQWCRRAWQGSGGVRCERPNRN